MKIKIRTTGFRFFLPVPIGLCGLVIRIMPGRLLEELQGKTPEPYDSLVTKETILMLWQTCAECLKENRGLEIVHVKAQDGTFVSIVL